MLSRIAESLYWIGRYCERAEDTARLLDVQYHMLLEDRGVDDVSDARDLLDVMGVDAASLDVELDATSAAEYLAHDTSYPGSIARSLVGAWENARGAREAISSEMWETLNSTYQALPLQSRGAVGPLQHRFFSWIKDRATTVAGLADATLSRDDGWHFLALGRCLERADMTTRLLGAHFGEGSGQTRWTTMLRSCSAHEAYLRTYRRAVDATLAVEFLLLDRLFPRSVFHSLVSAEMCVAELDPRSGRAGVDDDARRLLGRQCAELSYLRVDDLVAILPDLLARLQTTGANVHAAVAARYFRETRTIEWSI